MLFARCGIPVGQVAAQQLVSIKFLAVMNVCEDVVPQPKCDVALNIRDNL